jgi:hypothetical protein
MDGQLKTFGQVASGFARNPLGIIALFIVLIYGFASLVTIFTGGFAPGEKVPLIYFLIGFPILVLIVFTWLVSQHSGKLFAPGDFKSEDNYVRMLQLYATRKIREIDLKDLQGEPASEDIAPEETDTVLKGWIKRGDAPPHDYEVGIDPNSRYGGAISAYIKSRGVPRGFGTLMQTFKADAYKGKRLRMTGSAKSDGVRNWAGFWMRVDEPNNKAVSFDNMQESKGQRGGQHIKSYWRSQKIVFISRSDCSWVVRANYGFAISVSKLFLMMYRPRQNLAGLTFPTSQSI